MLLMNLSKEFLSFVVDHFDDNWKQSFGDLRRMIEELWDGKLEQDTRSYWPQNTEAAEKLMFETRVTELSHAEQILMKDEEESCRKENRDEGLWVRLSLVVVFVFTARNQVLELKEWLFSMKSEQETVLEKYEESARRIVRMAFMMKCCSQNSKENEKYSKSTRGSWVVSRVEQIEVCFFDLFLLFSMLVFPPRALCQETERFLSSLSFRHNNACLVKETSCIPSLCVFFLCVSYHFPCF